MFEIGMAGPGMVFVMRPMQRQHNSPKCVRKERINYVVSSLKLRSYAATTEADVAKRMHSCCNRSDWTWSGSQNPRERICAKEHLVSRNSIY